MVLNEALFILRHVMQFWISYIVSLYLSQDLGPRYKPNYSTPQPSHNTMRSTHILQSLLLLSGLAVAAPVV